MDPLRVYVVFEPAFNAGAGWVRLLSEAFCSLGMQRDEMRFGVPVQFRSEPWDAEQPGLPGTRHPRRIKLAGATSNCVLVLVDPVMSGFRQAHWAQYMADVQRQMDLRPGRDLLVPVLLSDQVPAFAQRVQAIRPTGLELPTDERTRVRFMAQLLNALLVHRHPESGRNTHQPGHGIFLSHAKRDGVDTAVRIVETISKVNQSLGPRCFFDADSLLPGDSYPERFELAIANGSLLAIVTDVYHSRPWCRWEVLTAKRLGRPIVVADLSTGRIERTYPYLGNVPSVRIDLLGDDTDGISEIAVERLIFALLAEALRIELWQERARQRLQGRPLRLLVRPPELADLPGIVDAVHDDSTPTWTVYPDPPLGTEEVDLLHRAIPDARIFSLSQATARL